MISKVKKLSHIIYSVWNKKYYIKRGYIHRKIVPHFDDTTNTDEWQNEVYSFAKEVFDQSRFKTVLDLGCGSGYKLFKYFNENLFIGVDVEPTLEFLKNTYPNERWVKLEEIKKEETFDLVICSDVIEHINDPHKFLKRIIKEIDFKKIILSTPERDLERGRFDFGPPRNIHHYREWNMDEFQKFLSPFFKIEKHFVISGRNKTQITLCEKRDSPE